GSSWQRRPSATPAEDPPAATTGLPAVPRCRPDPRDTLLPALASCRSAKSAGPWHAPPPAWWASPASAASAPTSTARAATTASAARSPPAAPPEDESRRSAVRSCSPPLCAHASSCRCILSNPYFVEQVVSLDKFRRTDVSSLFRSQRFPPAGRNKRPPPG